MKYFKNTELAKLYNVSEKTIRNWIHATSEGKLDFQLYDESGKLVIANTAKNARLIEQLVKKGKKYKNTRSFKVAVPTPNFYKQYSQKQIFDIVSQLDIYNEIPYQYSFFGEGAVYWDLYSKRLLEEKTSNTLNNTIQLLDTSMDYLTKLLKDYDAVNVIDVGTGNGLPVRGLLDNLIKQEKMHRYVGIDISTSMLDIARQNIKTWFGDKVRAETHIRDINYGRFQDLLMPDSFTKDLSTANLILFLGGTISNLRQPSQALLTIHESMGKNDFLVLSRRLDTGGARRYFDFVSHPNGPNHVFRGKAILDLLGIDENFYTMEQIYNEDREAREIRVKLNVALSIEFKLEGRQRAIELNKGESILLWRAWHRDAVEAIKEHDNNGFDLLQATRSKDKEYFQIISRVKAIEA